MNDPELHTQKSQAQDLQAIELAAVEMARTAGKLLMGYFRKPLQVDYKMANQRSPVTEADKAADEYIRGEIGRRFPAHAVLTEEIEEVPDRDAEFVWVIDPLDGTVNFMNGLPAWGVSIGVLHRDRPVVGAMFVPSIHSPEGNVLHAREGNGAFDDDMPISLVDGTIPRNSLISAMPTYFLRMYHFSSDLRRSIGDIRATGSTTFELVNVSRNVFQFAVSRSPWLWDVVAGIAVIKEAGGAVYTMEPGTKVWTPFERFAVTQAGAEATQSELRKWRAPVIVGTPQAAGFVAAGLAHRNRRLRNTWRNIKGRFGNK
ncbi:MAG: inositol monophosphatase [Dehalococcoidia bacterium]